MSALSKSLSVILVDDVEEIRTVVAHWLGLRGHRVASAASGSEAIKLLKSLPVDLLIVDVLMPEVDGLDVIKETQRLQPDARILAISGGGRYMDAEDCLKIGTGMGAHAVLLKPFTEAQLFAGFKAALTRPKE